MPKISFYHEEISVLEWINIIHLNNQIQNIKFNVTFYLTRQDLDNFLTEGNEHVGHALIDRRWHSSSLDSNVSYDLSLVRYIIWKFQKLGKTVHN